MRDKKNHSLWRRLRDYLCKCKRKSNPEKVIKKCEEAITTAIYNAKDIRELEEIEKAIEKCDNKLLESKIFANVPFVTLYAGEVNFFTQKLKKNGKLKKQINCKIKECKNYLNEFQYFYDHFLDCILTEYNNIQNDKKGSTINNLSKLENCIFEIDDNENFKNHVERFISCIEDYLNKTKSFDKYRTPVYYYFNINNIHKKIQEMCLKYENRCVDLKKFYLRLRLTIIEQRSFILSYLSKQYHEKYFKKARACFAWAFIWFIITSLLTHINLSAGILGEININFKLPLKVYNEWLQYIIWITIKTPSIILAWIGLSYLRAADRHDQDAKELSNLYQYKSMITDPVTQDALMVALAPNYFGTKRNRRSDNNFMEKLLLKMIPTLNINAGGGSNNGNNGGQNGGQTHE